MRTKNIRRRLSRILCLTVLAGATVFSAPAQETKAPKPASQTEVQSTANEDFELNISSERITETNFARSTSVGLTNNNRGSLRVEVGVGVRGEQIDVLMRGIYGRVRFRASLEALRQRIEQLKIVTTANPNVPLQ